MRNKQTKGHNINLLLLIHNIYFRPNIDHTSLGNSFEIGNAHFRMPLRLAWPECSWQRLCSSYNKKTRLKIIYGNDKNIIFQFQTFDLIQTKK